MTSYCLVNKTGTLDLRERIYSPVWRMTIHYNVNIFRFTLDTIASTESSNNTDDGMPVDYTLLTTTMPWGGGGEEGGDTYHAHVGGVTYHDMFDLRSTHIR